MKLSELLEKLAGRFELTVFVGEEPVCEDVEIYQDEEKVNWSAQISDYGRLKNAEVSDIYLTANRNYDGAAIWVTVKG